MTTSTMVPAADEMMRVLYEWGVKRIYGLPGGSLDSTMNSIHTYRDRIDYIGVRHEEFGALAAVAEAKITGRIGVMLGSAGPGAAHLVNGLYDAKMDNIPVLAIVGQVPSSRMNLDFFQELPENPMFADATVYNRTVMTAEQLPLVIDTAIRTAYAKRGPAVVVLPKDLGWKEIEQGAYPVSANVRSEQNATYPISEQKINEALDLLSAAKRPVIYFGQGARQAGEELLKASQLLGAPLMSTYLAKGIIDHDTESYMISTGRVATKPSVDAGRSADAVLFIGTNYEFGEFFFHPQAKFIDVNINPMVLGARHAAELGFQADARQFLSALNDAATKRGLDGTQSPWLAAAKENRAQWETWISKQTTDESPIRLETVFHEINKVAAPDALFGIDVGNVNIASARFLKVNPGQQFTTSPLFATMGYGLPAAVAGSLEYPQRQVWNLAGDGGITMVIQGLTTAAEHHLPIISVVLTNESLGYIEAEQDDTNQPHSGIALSDLDFAKIAEGFGVQGLTVRTADELRAALAKAQHTTEPILIDVKVTNDRMLPVEQFPQSRDERADFDEFRASYRAQDLEPFAEILARHQA
ncbi:pyruvate oxidase [Arcanobacterium pinnipediorum]|uniref:Pyruvate oxidase n=1 Tax=Arcanobacterium pinnipediorum TaxID=1503041 RepID=A0ABY5AG20_9ACTO|nr:pyruvate oxidase [Arcanobacterium pinnipediorum]USR78883.1 pyruvate oxidase [Arcanobacterium pinnipediorum]